MSRLETPMRMDILQTFLLSLMEMLHVFRYGTSDRRLHMRHNSLSRRFHDAVIKHCHEHHDVAFYAEYFNLTPKYFSSLIRSETGHSASHWISIYVVSQAKMLMRTQTNATLQQIGNMLGFTEQSNFSRYFKRETGLAPEVWRKQQFARKRESLRSCGERLRSVGFVPMTPSGTGMPNFLKCSCQYFGRFPFLSRQFMGLASMRCLPLLLQSLRKTS